MRYASEVVFFMLGSMCWLGITQCSTPCNISTYNTMPSWYGYSFSQIYIKAPYSLPSQVSYGVTFVNITSDLCSVKLTADYSLVIVCLYWVKTVLCRYMRIIHSFVYLGFSAGTGPWLPSYQRSNLEGYGWKSTSNDSQQTTTYFKNNLHNCCDVLYMITVYTAVMSMMQCCP